MPDEVAEDEGLFVTEFAARIQSSPALRCAHPIQRTSSSVVVSLYSSISMIRNLTVRTHTVNPRTS